LVVPRAPDSSRQTVAVLVELIDDPAQWRHGYDLAKTTGLASGTLYPLLARLAERGYLERQWEPEPAPGRPARHLYRLTADGADLARAARQRIADAARPRTDGAARLRPSPRPTMEGA
jgi:PadR family transcriptional regulator, regulatory protein PadR